VKPASRCSLSATLLAVLLGSACGAAEAAADAWQLETLSLKDGTRYLGLLLTEDEAELEFAEIVRPPGKGMFAVIRPVDPEQVDELQRLPPPERQKLQDRFAQFRARARIEAGRMQDVQLQPATLAYGEGWVFRSPWFRLESTADQEMTRRSVVRIEQIFRAYRQVLPPTRQPRQPLRMMLFGDMDQYRRAVAQWRLEITNPAFYSPANNLIVVGSDLNAYSRRLGEVRAHHARTRQQYQQWNESFSARLAEVLRELQRNGYSSAEIEQEARLRRAAWEREYTAALSRIDAAERRNNARFADITQQSLARLYHEAFHAYVENFVFPLQDHPMPHWLNEGLAQIFETAQIDADTLRIDAPDPVRLAQLQLDLSGPEPLRVVDVLTAEDDEFLNLHEGDAGQRLYIYAWGLAYYLMYEQNLLHGERLEQYVVNPDNFGPTARFVQLTEMPLEKFEPAWRRAVLELHARLSNQKPSTSAPAGFASVER
jgi:hypothetical protein